MTNVIKSNVTVEQSELSMQEYLDNDPYFPEMLFGLIYRGDFVDAVTNLVNNDDTQYTPLGMRWFRAREPDPTLPYNYPVADQSRPVVISLTCATCDDNTNPCFFDGI